MLHWGPATNTDYHHQRGLIAEITINYLFADSYQNPISEWHATIKMHLVAGFESDSDTYFIPHVACP